MKNKTKILHIGFSKCMSTWLQDQFAICNGVKYLYKTNYYPTYYDNYETRRNEYLRYYEDAVEDIVIESDEHIILPGIDEGMRINITNNNLVDEVISRIVNTIGDDTKIILVIRNQRDMIASKYAQYVRGGGKYSPERYVDTILSNYKYYMDLRYAKIIKKLYSVFGSENVFVVLLEEFKNNSEQISNRLNDFIGANCINSNYKIKGVNVSPSYYATYLQYLLNKLFIIKKNDQINRPKAWVPYKLWLYARIAIERLDAKIIKNKNKKMLIRNELLHEIDVSFCTDNKELSGLLSIDVKKYGYYYK